MCAEVEPSWLLHLGSVDLSLCDPLSLLHGASGNDEGAGISREGPIAHRRPLTDE